MSICSQFSPGHHPIKDNKSPVVKTISLGLEDAKTEGWSVGKVGIAALSAFSALAAGYLGAQYLASMRR